MSETLIQNTELERLMVSYKVLAESHPGSVLNMQRRNNIACQVVCAFEFLFELGKPYSEMTYNEFELAQREIRKRAKEELDKLHKELSKKIGLLYFL